MFYVLKSVTLLTRLLLENVVAHMERIVFQKLVEWKDSATRKPLILNGARQVGKTMQGRMDLPGIGLQHVVQPFCPDRTFLFHQL